MLLKNNKKHMENMGEGQGGWNPWHNAFEEASKIRLFESSKLLGLCATLLMNCCHTHGTSNVFIIELLRLIKTTSYYPNTLPSSKYEMSNTLKQLGLTYNTIDACVKGCMLFQNNYANVDQCIKCGEPS
jgi:hypothetical protein